MRKILRLLPFKFKVRKDRTVNVRVYAGPREETQRAILETLAVLPFEPIVYFGKWNIKRGVALPREVHWWMFHPDAWEVLQTSPWHILRKQPFGFAFGNFVDSQVSAQRNLLTLKRSHIKTVILTEPKLVKPDVWRYFEGKTVLIATEHFCEVRDALQSAEVNVLSLEAFAYEVTHGLVPVSLETGTYAFSEGRLVGLENHLLN